MPAASRGEMPKKNGSNRSIWSRKPPHRVLILPGMRRARIVERVDVEPIRRDLADRVDATVEQIPQRLRPGRPGKRQPMPMMAIGACIITFSPLFLLSAMWPGPVIDEPHSTRCGVGSPLRPARPPVCHEHTTW